MNLPIGWESRQNGGGDAFQEVSLTKISNWSNFDVAARYDVPMEQLNGEGAVPFGWESRKNRKTLEELALAQSASDIAVAEVHSKDRRSITGGNEEFLFKDITIATTPLKRMGLEEESITKMIAAVVVRVNTTVMALENKIDRLEQKVDVISGDNKQILLNQEKILVQLAEINRNMTKE